MATMVKTLAAAGLFTMISLSPALAAQPDSDVDLIDDRPSVLSTVLGTAADMGGWVWEKLSSVVSVVLPPSPTRLSKTIDAEDSSELLKLLGTAGYKLKEIDNQVGIIPTVAFKFALVRELSEADWEYLDYRLALSRFKNQGLGATVQRAIVETVMAVNTGAAYQVSELKVQVLPLPKVAFSVTPKVTALGEESSALMRAIQRMEKRLRGDIARFSGQMLPTRALHKYIVMREALAWAAIVLFAVTVLVEIRRLTRRAPAVRRGPGLTLGALGATTLLWTAYAVMPLSLMTLAGGLGLIAVVALISAGTGASEPVPAAVAGEPAAPQPVAEAPAAQPVPELAAG
jgi:hypothetical protein